MSLDHFFKRIDARYRLPRPANALHLDAYQAGFRLLRDVGEGLVILACGVITAFIIWEIANIIQATFETRIYFIFGMIIAVLISLYEALSLVLLYYRISQRLTHGSARWADVPTLRSMGLAHLTSQPLAKGALRLGRLTRKYDLALPCERVICHTAIFGPPNSGKSSSFIMTMARDWSRTGSAIFLDPKGELFKYTARHFRTVYRLDLAQPWLSDRWNFVPACKGDAELAHEVASIIVGFDANKVYNGDPSEFIREELRRIEANAEATRDAGLLRQLDEFERRLNERSSPTERMKPGERLGRAMARETMAEVAYRESAERLVSFNERADAQPLAIESKDGRINVHRLKETKPHSVVERALRPLLEKPAARETRHAIEAASAYSQARLMTDYEKSRAYLEAAREIASSLRAEVREQAIDKIHLMPAFTPKERINLEIYAERQADPRERAHYLSLARGEVVQATPVQDAYGNRFAHDQVSRFDHGRAAEQSHTYNTYARSTGRAR